MSKSDWRKFILCTTPTDGDKTLKGSRLPTERAVLLSLLAFRQSSVITKRDAANKTVAAALPFFLKASIPTLQKHKMTEAIETLVAEFENILKIKPAARDSGKPKERIEKF